MTERRLPPFPPSSGFYTVLRAAVDEATVGHELRDAPATYAKIAVIVAGAIGCYGASLALSGSLVLALSIPLGLLLAAIGFNVQHDGAHGALSRSRFVNRCAAFSLDLLGGSSYVWRWKHNLYHHSHPNVGGVDSDIDIAPLGRLAPFHRRRWFHRYQHLYLWILYALLPLKWQFVDDFLEVLRGRIGDRPLPRPRGMELLLFVTGKAAFFTLALVIPTLVHGIPLALTFYLLTSMVLGFVLSVVFQLAHCGEETAFYPCAAADEWALHQIATTMDFAPNSRVVNWYTGGLNFQIEHHLFPRFLNVHYARIAPVVQRICAERGISYHVHDTLGDALRSHYRMLRDNGRETCSAELSPTCHDPAPEALRGVSAESSHRMPAQ